MSDQEEAGNSPDEDPILIGGWSRISNDIKRAARGMKEKTSETQRDEEQPQQEPGSSKDKEILPPESLDAWHRIREDIRYHKEFTENRTRQVLVYSIITIFMIWIVISLIYFLFTAKGDMLTTGSSVLAGPFGAVLGYYLAKGEQKGK